MSDEPINSVGEEAAVSSPILTFSKSTFSLSLFLSLSLSLSLHSCSTKAPKRGEPNWQPESFKEDKTHFNFVTKNQLATGIYDQKREQKKPPLFYLVVERICCAGVAHIIMSIIQSGEKLNPKKGNKKDQSLESKSARVQQ